MAMPALHPGIIGYALAAVEHYNKEIIKVTTVSHRPLFQKAVGLPSSLNLEKGNYQTLY